MMGGRRRKRWGLKAGRDERKKERGELERKHEGMGVGNEQRMVQEMRKRME